MIASRKALIVVAALVAVMLGLPWGGAAPAASEQPIAVTSANPPSGDQATLSLDVVIGGKSFKNGAKAAFFKTGTTDPAGVTVKSTKYVSATQIVATIDIADTAALAQFDIQVQNTDGRTGKGTELFSVTVKKIDPCTAPDPAPSPSWYVSTSGTVPGALDATFGSNGTGKVVGPRYLGVGHNLGRAIAVQPGGKIVAVGSYLNTCTPGASSSWGIARYRPDGSLDSTFGSGGLVLVTFAGGAGAIAAVVVQPADGKVVVVGSALPKKSGSAQSQAVVVRLNPNGSLDSTFGSGGVAWVPPTSGGMLEAVVLQSDGKIVAAGVTAIPPYLAFLSRLSANGTLDTTFNGTGTYFGSASVRYQALTAQTLGGREFIVVAGYAHDGLNHPIGAVWRFDPSGLLDSTFGASGMVTTSFHDEDGLYHSDVFHEVAVDSANHIVAVGSAWVTITQQPLVTQSSLALARYGLDGTLDTTFGSGGKVWAWSTEGNKDGLGLAVQPDNKIVVAGYDAGGNLVDSPAGLWRFNSDGTVDAGFGTGGFVLDPVVNGSSHAGWNAVALLPDGRIVCGGDVVMPAGTTNIFYAALARFWQ